MLVDVALVLDLEDLASDVGAEVLLVVVERRPVHAVL
jgi:hypothetical protein